MRKEYDPDYDHEVIFFTEKEAYLWAAGFNPEDEAFRPFNTYGVKKLVSDDRKAFAKLTGAKFLPGGVDKEGLGKAAKKILDTLCKTVDHAWLFESYVQEGPFPFVKAYHLREGGWIEYDIRSKKHTYNDGKGSCIVFDEHGNKLLAIAPPSGASAA